MATLHLTETFLGRQDCNGLAVIPFFGMFSARYAEYKLRFRGVTISVVAGQAYPGQPTIFLSPNGSTAVDKGSVYRTTAYIHLNQPGITPNPNNPNGVFMYMNQPVGLLVAIDAQDDAAKAFGWNGDVTLYSPGSINGVAKHTMYRSDFIRSDVPGNPHASNYHGSYTGAVGQRVKGLTVELTIGTAVFDSGHIDLYGIESPI